MKKLFYIICAYFSLITTTFANSEVITSANSTIDLKVGGEINFQNFSIPTLSIIAGALDGFNPCALFILLFLLSVVLTSKDRKKVILYGGTFILVSGLTYFGILTFLLYGVRSVPAYYKVYIENIIGTIAAIIGLVSIYKAFEKKDDGCDVMDEKKRNFFFKKIKVALEQKSMIIGLAGIAIVAFLINFLEMFCSVGIPITYTTILSNQDFSMLESMLYISLYIFFFLIIHIIIYITSIVSFKLVAVSNKYTKIINLIGGLLMVFLGLTMIFKPELLNVI